MYYKKIKPTFKCNVVAENSGSDTVKKISTQHQYKAVAAGCQQLKRVTSD
jgi:hypothetical protein